ncbi:hypothetical protein CFP56_016713 [Quercus suber]|uniref:Uncharacterized protein n=1 Tax=Quercus suber TaxID=58331 RepID=A0AAW0KP60_QUESU
MPEFIDEHHAPAYLVKTYKELLETNQYQVIDGKSCMENRATKRLCPKCNSNCGGIFIIRRNSGDKEDDTQT